MKEFDGSDIEDSVFVPYSEESEIDEEENEDESFLADSNKERHYQNVGQILPIILDTLKDEAHHLTEIINLKNTAIQTVQRYLKTLQKSPSDGESTSAKTIDTKQTNVQNKDKPKSQMEDKSKPINSEPKKRKKSSLPKPKKKKKKTDNLPEDTIALQKIIAGYNNKKIFET